MNEVALEALVPILKPRIRSLGVNPNIKLVGEYNYSGGFWLSLSSLFFCSSLLRG